MPRLAPEAARPHPDGVVLSVHVQPNAAQTVCAGVYGQAVRIRVAAPPVGGAANLELARFLSERLGLRRRAIEIRSGAGSRHKQVLLRGASLRVVKEQLGL